MNLTTMAPSRARARTARASASMTGPMTCTTLPIVALPGVVPLFIRKGERMWECEKEGPRPRVVTGGCKRRRS